MILDPYFKKLGGKKQYEQAVQELEAELSA